MWNETRNDFDFLLISLSYLLVESQIVSRVTCLSLDYNFESSILFLHCFLIFQLPSPLCPSFTDSRTNWKQLHTILPRTIDTLGCTWNTTSVFTHHTSCKRELRFITNFTLVNYREVWNDWERIKFEEEERIQHFQRIQKFIFHRYNATSISRNSIESRFHP